MEITIEIDDDLLRQAEARAAERGETMRAFLARGLRRELDADSSRKYGSG